MRGLRLTLSCLVLGLFGCEASEPLVLDLRTDLVAGREFAAVEVEVSPAGGTPQRVRHEIEEGLDYLGGARVAELGSVPHGSVDVRVSLLDATDRLVVDRLIRVQVQGPIAVTALVARTCRDVSCPGEGDPREASTCVGGQCVDPRCSELDPTSCGEAQCASDGECSVGPGCTRGACIEGRCALVPDDARCPDTEICEAGAGCIPPSLFGACDATRCELGPWTDPAGGASPSSARRAAGSARGGGFTRARGTLELLGVEGDGATAHVAFRDGARVRTYGGPPDALRPLEPLDVDGAAFARSLSVAWAPDGEPIVSALTDTGLHVFRHSGGWRELPVVTTEISAPFGYTALAYVGPDPVVAYEPTDGGLRVVRFDGAAWVELGLGAGVGAGVAAASARLGGVALTGRGTEALLAWTDSASGTSRVFLLRWDGAAWVELAGSASGNGIGSATGAARAPSVAFDASGAPLVAWSGAASGSDVYLQRWNGAAWEAVGGGSNGPGGLSGSSETSSTPALRVLADGGLALTWTDTVGLGPSTHQVRLYDGSAWSNPGLPESLGSRSSDHIVIGNARDDACVVFEASGNGFVSCWDGSRWTEVGSSDVVASIDGTSDPSYAPALTVSADGTVDVIWEELNRPFGNIVYSYARAAVGSSWVERVAGAAQGTGLGDLDADRPFAFDDGGPVVGWRTGSTCLMLRHFDGSSFAEYTPGSASGCGVVPDAGADTRWPVGIVGPDGRPWLAFQEHCVDWNVYVIRYTGAAWEFVGGANCVSTGASQLRLANRPAMAVDRDGGVVLAYEGNVDAGAPGQIYVRRWDGAAWQELAGSGSGAGISNSPVGARHPALAIDATGRAFVAWEEGEPGATQIHARFFDGDAWVEAAGSATGGGVSASSGSAVTPHMVADGSGRPVLFWSDDASGTAEIYGRRWTGAGWQELSGSASGGGISNSDAPSYELDVAAMGDRVCVAWQEPDASAGHVFARCIDLGG